MKNLFIPKNQNKTVVSLRIHNSMLKMIDELAIQSDVSRNELIRQLLEFALQRSVNIKKKK